MQDQFRGKVAYVTGGSLGIGAGICRMFAARGASVVIGFGRSKAAAEALAGEMGSAVTSGGDIIDPDTAKAGVRAAMEHFGRLDIVVASAGLSGREPIEAITQERYRLLFDTNVLGTIYTVQAALPHITKPGGKIITVSSRIGLNPMPEAALYAGSKAAVDAMTVSFAKELGPQGITVNSVAPGLIETDRMAGAVAERGEAVAAATPLRRIGQPDDVAGVVAFLASDDARWITGRTIRADGGIV